MSACYTTRVFRRLNDRTDVVAACSVAGVLLLVDLALCGLIVWRVPYTEIDWVAYMQEVEGWLGGEHDYGKLRGDTGFGTAKSDPRDVLGVCSVLNAINFWATLPKRRIAP